MFGQRMVSRGGKSNRKAKDARRGWRRASRWSAAVMSRLGPRWRRRRRIVARRRRWRRRRGRRGEDAGHLVATRVHALDIGVVVDLLRRELAVRRGIGA